MSVSVVIPTWNGRALLETCLASLARQSSPADEIVVVDNGSTDGTTAHLGEHWPAVRVVALGENLGFAAAANRGIQASSGEIVVLVNNDVELHVDFLRELVTGLSADPGAASAAAKMLRFDDRGVIDATGDTLRWSGVAMQRGQGERDRGQYDAPGRVFSACAGAAAYRRAALDEVGPFDEAFFAYLEDVDWGFRAQLAGWACAYVPTAVAHHVGSASTRREGRPDPFFYGLPRRNAVWLVLKNYPADALLRAAPLVLRNQAELAYVAVRDGMGRAYLSALWAAARGLPQVLAQRRAIQRARRVGRRELEPLITRGRVAR